MAAASFSRMREAIGDNAEWEAADGRVRDEVDGPGECFGRGIVLVPGDVVVVRED